MSSQQQVLLLLAAGQSRRFGSNKLLARMPDGRFVIQHTLQVYSKLVGVKKYVLIATENKQLLDLLAGYDDWTPILINEESPAMGLSIARGVKSVSSSFTPHAWMIALADMPYIDQLTVENLFSHFSDMSSEDAKILQPVYYTTDNRLKPGHPVLFSGHFSHSLSLLKKDEGAKSIIKENRSVLKTYPVSDPGVISDIDHPEDINRP